MRRIVYFIAIIAVVGMACNLTNVVPSAPTVEEALPETPSSEDIPTVEPKSEKKCGDGICDGPETAQTCPEDCSDPGEEPEPGEPGGGIEFGVQNPTSGNELYVHVTVPKTGAGPYPTLVLIPGGTGSSNDFLRKGMPSRLSAAGFVIVVFDPDGRRNSPGEEDFNGHIHQDGLAAVIEFAAGLPEVDATNLGLVSFSYGITMGSGTLARHPELPIIFLIDWEGPADRFDTTVECTNSTRIDFAPCDDEAFWLEREALRFIPNVPVPYLRLQSEQDHVQADNSHAINMINGAIAGGNSWVRLNDLAVNEMYNPDQPPSMLAEQLDKNLAGLVEQYGLEMLALHGK